MHSNLQTGELWWSPRMLKTLGYDPRQMPGDRDWVRDHMLHPNDREQIDAFLCSDSDRSDALVRLRHADGCYRTMLMRLTLQRDGDGKAIRGLGTVADVTERRAAEAQRVALARELHDSVVQDLASARTYASTAMPALRQRSDAVSGVLDVLSEQLASAEETCA